MCRDVVESLNMIPITETSSEPPAENINWDGN